MSTRDRVKFEGPLFNGAALVDFSRRSAKSAQEQAEATRDEARREAPVDTGNLVRKIYTRIIRGGVEVGAYTSYARFVASGRKPGKAPRLQDLVGWVERHPGWIRGRPTNPNIKYDYARARFQAAFRLQSLIRRYGVKANPFMARAQEQTRPDFSRRARTTAREWARANQ